MPQNPDKRLQIYATKAAFHSNWVKKGIIGEKELVSSNV
jgi:hypothetical protein